MEKRNEDRRGQMDRGGGGNSPYDNEMENSRPSELLILMNGAMGESPV